MQTIKAPALRWLSAAALLLPLAAQASSLTTLHSFHLKAQYPQGGLVNVASNLYGVGSDGGASSLGTAFRIQIGGGPGEATIHTFTGSPDGDSPFPSLTKGGGLFYGTAHSGGAYGQGTIFSMQHNGAGYVTRYSFGGSFGDGASPSAGLVYSGGNVYGTTQGGGTSYGGTVFKMDSSNNVTVLHSFSGGTDGRLPYGGVVKIGSYLYGTTSDGGVAGQQGFGTVYRVKIDGTNYQQLHVFNGSDGQSPESALVSFAGSLFGITKVGGASGLGEVFRIDVNGANFAVVYSFLGGTDGAYPFGALLPVFVDPAVPGALYGMTYSGGASGQGTVFKVDVGGTETMLYPFTGGADGGIPQAEFIEVNGVLYGTTYVGGAYGKGTVFAFTP